MDQEEFLQNINCIDNYILHKDFESAFILFILLIGKLEDEDKKSVIIYYKKMLIEILVKILLGPYSMVYIYTQDVLVYLKNRG